MAGNPNKQDSEPEFYQVTIQRDAKAPLGIRIADKSGPRVVTLTGVDTGSIFDGKVKVDDFIVSVNGVRVNTSKKCAEQLTSAGNNFTLILGRARSKSDRSAPSAGPAPAPSYVYQPPAPRNVPTPTRGQSPAPRTGPVPPQQKSPASRAAPMHPREEYVIRHKQFQNEEMYLFDNNAGSVLLAPQQMAKSVKELRSPPKEGPPLTPTPPHPFKPVKVVSPHPPDVKKALTEQSPVSPPKEPIPTPAPAVTPKAVKPKTTPKAEVKKAYQPPSTPPAAASKTPGGRVEAVSKDANNEADLPEEIRKTLEEGKAQAEKERADGKKQDGEKVRSIMKGPRQKSKKKKGVSLRGDIKGGAISDVLEVSISDSIDPKKQLRKVPKRS